MIPVLRLSARAMTRKAVPPNTNTDMAHCLDRPSRVGSRCFGIGVTLGNQSQLNVAIHDKNTSKQQRLGIVYASTRSNRPLSSHLHRSLLVHTQLHTRSDSPSALLDSLNPSNRNGPPSHNLLRSHAWRYCPHAQQLCVATLPSRCTPG